MSNSSYNFGAGDIAHRILEAVFGGTWDNMFTSGPSGNLATLIVDIFTVYNSAVVLATSLIVGYTVWSSTVQSAHEGQTLGKRYSQLWTPLRMVAGGAMTAPVFGLSLIQMIVLSIVGMSFYVANEAASKLGTFLGDGGSLSITDSYVSSTEANTIAAALIQMETCTAYKNARLSEMSSLFSGSPVTPKWDDQKLVYGKSGILGFGDETCGSIKIQYDGKYLSPIQSGINDMATAIRPAAADIVSGKTNVSGSHYETALAKYEQMMLNLAATAKADSESDVNQALTQVQTDIANNGWLALGTWYFQIMTKSAERNQSKRFTVNTVTPTLTDADKELGGMQEYITRAGKYISTSAQSASGGASGVNPTDGEADALETGMKKFQASIIGYLNADGDPFLKLVSIGQLSFEIGVGLWTGGKVIGFATSFIPNWMPDKFTKMIESIGSFLAFIGGFLSLIGIWLGWYLPMLPFVNWVIGSMGVFIAIIQSIFAAQIWGAAHAVPSGEGMAGQHAQQGYMLLISLALRPILIVMCFVFSYFIIWAGSYLTVQGLIKYMPTVRGGLDGLIIGTAVGLISAAIMITTILHRALGFIFEAADDILAWIGGGRQLGSEGSAIQRATSALVGIIHKGESTGSRMGLGMKKGIKPSSGGNKKTTADLTM